MSIKVDYYEPDGKVHSFDFDASSGRLLVFDMLMNSIYVDETMDPVLAYELSQIIYDKFGPDNTELLSQYYDLYDIAEEAEEKGLLNDLDFWKEKLNAL